MNQNIIELQLETVWWRYRSRQAHHDLSSELLPHFDSSMFHKVPIFDSACGGGKSFLYENCAMATSVLYIPLTRLKKVQKSSDAGQRL